MYFSFKWCNSSGCDKKSLNESQYTYTDTYVPI